MTTQGTLKEQLQDIHDTILTLRAQSDPDTGPAASVEQIQANLLIVANKIAIMINSMGQN